MQDFYRYVLQRLEQVQKNYLSNDANEVFAALSEVWTFREV